MAWLNAKIQNDNKSNDIFLYSRLFYYFEWNWINIWFNLFIQFPLPQSHVLFLHAILHFNSKFRIEIALNNKLVSIHSTREQNNWFQLVVHWHWSQIYQIDVKNFNFSLLNVFIHFLHWFKLIFALFSFEVFIWFIWGHLHNWLASDWNQN